MFQGWENFYYLTGSAAAGLIGLLFVVITLTANFNTEKAERGQRLFMTPTVMQLTLAFLTSALALAPKLDPQAHRWAIAAVIAWGLIYTAPAAFRLVRRREAISHWTDIWFYGVWPVVIYAVLEISVVDWALPRDAACRLMALGLLALLTLAIRNAWDLITWLAPRRNTPPENLP